MRVLRSCENILLFELLFGGTDRKSDGQVFPLVSCAVDGKVYVDGAEEKKKKKKKDDDRSIDLRSGHHDGCRYSMAGRAGELEYGQHLRVQVGYSDQLTRTIALGPK